MLLCCEVTTEGRRVKSTVVKDLLGLWSEGLLVLLSPPPPSSFYSSTPLLPDCRRH